MRPFGAAFSFCGFALIHWHMVSGIMAWAGAVTPPKNRQGPVILMDEVKHPHANTAGQIDVASIRHCLQEGDARLALQHCHELLADDPQHIQTLLFAILATCSLGSLVVALNFINGALLWWRRTSQPYTACWVMCCSCKSGPSRRLARCSKLPTTS